MLIAPLCKPDFHPVLAHRFELGHRLACSDCLSRAKMQPPAPRAMPISLPFDGLTQDCLHRGRSPTMSVGTVGQSPSSANMTHDSTN